MRRILILCAVLLAGCAKSEPPVTESSQESVPAAIALADVAGTWEGTVTRAGNDTVLTTIQTTAPADGGAWTMTVANATDPSWSTTATATHVAADGDSIVADFGPFASVLRKGDQVTTHGVYRLEDGKLVGDITATYPASGAVVMLHSVSTRKAP